MMVLTPATFLRQIASIRKNITTSQRLCHQVAETLDQVLSGEIADNLLQCLHIVSVRPAPDASRLLVTLHADCKREEFDRDLLEDRLAASKGRLRCEVAAAITRRKAPSLIFNLIGPDSTSPTSDEEARP